MKLRAITVPNANVEDPFLARANDVERSNSLIENEKRKTLPLVSDITKVQYTPDMEERKGAGPTYRNLSP